MNIWLCLLLAAAAVMLLVLACMAYLARAAKRPAVLPGYEQHVTPGAPLEGRYTGRGSRAVTFAAFDAPDTRAKHFTVWYPADMVAGEALPLVVMVNGTGVGSSRYAAVSEHLASWGFLVIGNEDQGSWDGTSSAESLAFMLRCHEDSASIFHGRVDTAHIGIAGHSQGGVGAINAVTAQPNGSRYAALYTASTTSRALAAALNWHYDPHKVAIPWLMTAGTLRADAGDGQKEGIAPLASLQENAAACPDTAPVVCARRVHADHGDMLALADGCMTAWFAALLQGDRDAAQMFTGAEPELLRNGNWQDVMIRQPQP
ncbi:MAG: alpha/beta hydrolase [Aristaeellaceae bacterium]